MVETRPDKYSWQMKFNYNKLDAEGNPDTNWNTAYTMDWIWKATMQEQMQSTH